MDNALRWFIYALKDPRDGLVYYVGKSNNPDVRFRAHLRGAARRRHPSERWIDDLRTSQVTPTLHVIDGGCGDGACAAERAWIAEHRRRGAPLVNIADGGNGHFGPVTDTLRQRIREAHLGTRHSEETKRKMSASQTGRSPTDATRDKLRAANLGKKRSLETRERIRRAKTGTVASETTREKMSVAHMGHAVSATTRARIAAAKVGIPRTEECRAKIAAALTGRPLSEATKAKLRVAQSARRERERLERTHGSNEEGGD